MNQVHYTDLMEACKVYARFTFPTIWVKISFARLARRDQRYYIVCRTAATGLLKVEDVDDIQVGKDRS